MVHLVDTVDVDPALVDDYLGVVRGLGVAVMTDAGAALVSCATTPRDMGEPVSIQVVWGFDDFAHWNDIRRRLVLDPRWYDYGSAVARLRAAGTRRFYLPGP